MKYKNQTFFVKSNNVLIVRLSPAKLLMTKHFKQLIIFAQITKGERLSSKKLQRCNYLETIVS